MATKDMPVPKTPEEMMALLAKTLGSVTITHWKESEQVVNVLRAYDKFDSLEKALAPQAYKHYEAACELHQQIRKAEGANRGKA